jgi:hypothetical protein
MGDCNDRLARPEYRTPALEKAIKLTFLIPHRRPGALRQYALEGPVFSGAVIAHGDAGALFSAGT